MISLEKPDFFLPGNIPHEPRRFMGAFKNRFFLKGGMLMKATHTTSKKLRHAELIAGMFAFLQAFLAMGLFFALKNHLV